MINFLNSVGQVIARIDHTARTVHSILKHVELIKEAQHQYRNGNPSQRYASSNLVEAVRKHGYSVNEVSILPEDKVPSECHIGLPMRRCELEMFGVDSDFLDKIGWGPEVLETLLKNSSYGGSYSKNAIWSFRTPSFEPLNISEELEYLLGIPPIPVEVSSNPNVLKHYMAARQFKYKYKLMMLLGFTDLSDLGNVTLTEVAAQMAKFNNTKPHKDDVQVYLMLVGHMVFDLNKVMDYPFLFKNEFEHTTIPLRNGRY